MKGSKEKIYRREDVLLDPSRFVLKRGGLISWLNMLKSRLKIRAAIKRLLGKSDSRKQYSFWFFVLDESIRDAKDGKVIFSISVRSAEGTFQFNGYQDDVIMRKPRGIHNIAISIDTLEVGENIFAYTGECDIQSISFFVKTTASSRGESTSTASSDFLDQAGSFLLDSQIQHPKASAFTGSLYGQYNYDDRCYRLPHWLWSDAPAVSAFLALERHRDTASQAYAEAAIDIGKVMLKHQCLDENSDIYGAVLSRYRYYTHYENPFEALYGPNDTSFMVKWALLPLYVLTKESRYLKRSLIAMDWVAEVILSKEYLPSHYYEGSQSWEKGAFVDTGFTTEGFLAINPFVDEGRKKRYAQAVRKFIDRYLDQFKLRSGFYCSDITPHGEQRGILFSRGQGWALEGLLAAFQLSQEQKYLDEAIALASVLTSVQRNDGAWPFWIGRTEADERMQRRGGTGDKGTALLALLYVQLYEVIGKKKYLTVAERAISWCEENMSTVAGNGFGGIHAVSKGAGIIDFPYYDMGTGYTNAFYILAKIRYLEIEKDL